jgi:two-component system nitrogen regulation response regulator NtrX
MKSVLYLGCAPAERPEAEKALAAAQVSATWADTVPQALAELQRRDMPVLLDLSRGAGALQSARELKTQRAGTLMFALVDPRRPDLTTEAVLAGMADVFARPLEGRRLANAIERELGYEARMQVGPCAGPHAQDLYTHSPSMREVVEVIARAAAARSGVIVKGENGSGRQMVARTIHVSASDAPGVFVTVDCAAFDADDLERELFGRALRAANGDNGHALERIARESVLHTANGGTLYLQNIADAPTRVQGRLARLLRDREAIILDTGETANVDVRPMAGVDPGVDDLVREGRLREDLYRRLSPIVVDLPPLRQRREDIPALANYCVRDICAALRVPPKTLSRPALSLIGALPWRGNVVELRTLLESVVTGLAGGRGIGLEDVLAHVKLDGGSLVFASGGGTLRQARARFEREYIAAVLDQHRGRITDAAKALGIQRTNLYRKMRSLRVKRSKRPSSGETSRE